MKSVVNNRKVYFEYEILEKITAGICLKGSEIKSVRHSSVSISEAYCFIKNGEIFIKGMNISIFEKGGLYNNHEPLRERKLLLNKREIIKLQENISQKGLTIVPIEVILNDTGFVKVIIGLGRGKNNYDKRVSLKDKDLKRDLDRNI